MTIGIDIDDTITDTFSYLQPYTAEYCSKPLEELECNNISYDSTPPEWGLVMEEFAAWCFDRLIPFTPPKKDAPEVIKLLHDLGHRIVIITNRNNRLYTDCYLTTRMELRNCGIEYDSLICSADKAGVCIAEDVDFFIDDNVSNLKAVQDAGIRVVMFRSPVNTAYSAMFETVSSWEEVKKLLVSG